MTTLAKISEQVRRIHAKQTPSPENINPKYQDREIRLLIVQATHEILGLSIQQAAQYGDINIPTCMIATYSGITVDGPANGKYVPLPAYPIKLPMDMGVWSVVSDTGTPYIPITPASWDLLGSLDEGLLEDSAGFYVEGRNIKFTKDPSTTVTVKLLIVDPAEFGENDPYPVPTDMEGSIITRTLELMGAPSPEKPKG